MADISGALHHTFEGKTYTLRLTPRGLAHLQADHGLDLPGALSKGYEGTPPFGVLGGIVTEVLKKGEGLDEES